MKKPSLTKKKTRTAKATWSLQKLPAVRKAAKVPLGCK